MNVAYNVAWLHGQEKVRLQVICQLIYKRIYKKGNKILQNFYFKEMVNNTKLFHVSSILL